MRTSFFIGAKCIRCGKEFDESSLPMGCPFCETPKSKANLTTVYDYKQIGTKIRRKQRSLGPDTGLWKFKNLLPVKKEEYMLTLGEGNTPLIPSQTTWLNGNRSSVYLKLEFMNPTLSYKDRHCCVSVSKAAELGKKFITISSTGNHGLATAAYAARAGLECIILTSTHLPASMQIQIQMYPATVYATETMQQRWELIKKGVQKYGWWCTGNFLSPPIGSEPYGVDGYKTISFEIYEQLDGNVPDYLVCPVSFGDGLFGIWKGFYELTQVGLTETIPKMVGAECSFAGPLTNALTKGLDFVEEVPAGNPSIAYTISVTNSTYHALKCIRDSGGTAVMVDDTEIIEAQRSLLNEGIYVEPTAAVAVAAVKRLARAGDLREGQKTVIILTSAGVKHQEDMAASQRPIQRVTSFNQLEHLWGQANS